jgi:large subunit ribosomal protein L1
VLPRLQAAGVPGWPRFSSSVPSKVDEVRAQHLDEALRIIHAYDCARYGASVDIAVRLNVDVKRSDERVRGSALLPHGTGKNVRVAVFARGELAEEALGAGAEVVGAEDLINEVLKGRLDFERVIAAPDVLPALAKAARTLGPKGLMPNPKRGTVTVEIADAVKRAKGGEVEFRANKEGGILHSTIGRMDFPREHLRANALVLLCAPPPLPAPLAP